MPFENHMRLTMLGVFNDGTSDYEAFSVGINLSDPSTQVGDFSQGRLEDYADDAAAMWASVNAGISAHAKLREVKLAQIGTDGKYRSEPLIAVRNVTGGGGPGIAHPPQVALCVSLVTETRGATGRGRFYLPLPAFGVAGGGLISDPAQAGVATEMQTFLNNLNNVPGVDPLNTPRVTVASSKGYNSDVTGVRVGKALDTIRTRRRGLVEAYDAPLAVSAN